MFAFIIRRLLAVIPVLAVVAVFVFLMLRLTPGDPAAVIGVGRLVLPGHEAAVGRHLLGGPEPLRLRQEGNDRLGRPRADPGDGCEDLDPLIRLGQLVEFPLRLVEQFLDVGQFAQRQVQAAAPQFRRGAVGDGLGVRGDAGQAELGPGPVPAWRRQPLSDQDSANAVLQGHPPAHPLLTGLDQAPLLADVFLGDGHAGELAELVDLRQTQGIVAIGLALEVLEFPGLAGRVGDQAPDALRDAQVTHPAGEQTRLEEDHVRPVPAGTSGWVPAATPTSSWET